MSCWPRQITPSHHPLSTIHPAIAVNQHLTTVAAAAIAVVVQVIVAAVAAEEDIAAVVVAAIAEVVAAVQIAVVWELTEIL